MPTLAAFGGGRGAVFDVVMEPHPTGSCGRPRWRIASIGVAGGTGYANNSLLTILPAAGDVTVTAAVARVQTVGGVPQSVTIQNQGIYYRPTTGKRDLPIITAAVGGGAKLGVALEQLDGEPAGWKVSYVSVLLPGAGLADGAAVSFSNGDRTEGSGAAATVVVDDNGGVVGVTITHGGEYYRDTDLPARVSEPTFTIGGSPSAVVRGLIENDPESEAFGQVIDLVIDSPGNVTGFRQFEVGNDSLNGESIVVRASTSDSLITPCISSCHGSGALLEVVGHVPPNAQAFLEGGDPVFPGVSVPFLVYFAKIAGTAPHLWGVSKLEYAGQLGGLPEPGTKINFFTPIDGSTTTVEPAAAELGEDLEPVVTSPGKFFSTARVWDGVPGPLTGIDLRSGGSGYALRGRVAPALSAVAFGSSPMAVSVAEKVDSCGLPFWEVDEITPAGSNVTNRRVLTIQRDPLDTEAVSALAVVSTRQEPAVTATPPAEPQPDEPATFSVTLSKTAMMIPPRATLTPGVVAGDAAPACWSVASIEITNSGRGYPTVTRLNIEVSSGTQTKPAAALAFANNDGQIVEVVVETGGEFFLDNGVPQEVVIVRRGAYYREDSALPPYVATPTVTLTQIPPSDGTGAVIELKVDADPASESFGQITNATIPQGQGGTGYHMRSGPRPEAFLGDEIKWIGGPVLLRATPQGLTLESVFTVSSDTGLPSKTAIVLDMANKRAGVNCSDWFTNALTPVTRTSAGSVTAVPGYTP
jgi:hypothetical protein